MCIQVWFGLRIFLWNHEYVIGKCEHAFEYPKREQHEQTQYYILCFMCTWGIGN